MAFEDRSSPSAATSPTNSLDITAPNSPESSRTSPYTCTTISVQDYSRTESPKPVTSSCGIFRITSFALSPNSSSSNPSPSPSMDEPTIQTFKYSIRNILQPDFGKTALLKSRTPSSTIAFRPYEDAYEGNDEERNGRVSPPPLGSLCQTVSQIGLKTEANVKSSAAKLPDPDEVKKEDKAPQLWPAWVYCTRYSDRPSSGPRSRRVKKTTKSNDDKRPRTAFSSAQLARLKHEFAENRYLTERRRQQLSGELGLNEAQIKIWFQNKRAKIKKSSGEKNPLALQLMAQGLYNHSTVPCDEDDLPLA